MQHNTFATRLYGTLLHLYPADFRQTYGDAMTCIFEESLSDAVTHSGSTGVLKLWLNTFIDLATSAVAEWGSRSMVILGIEERTSLAASITIHIIVLFSLLWMGVNAGGLHPRPSTTPVCRK